MRRLEFFKDLKNREIIYYILRISVIMILKREYNRYNK